MSRGYQPTKQHGIPVTPPRNPNGCPVNAFHGDKQPQDRQPKINYHVKVFLLTTAIWGIGSCLGWLVANQEWFRTVCSALACSVAIFWLSINLSRRFL